MPIVAMPIALNTALLYGASRGSWLSFSLGLAAGLAFVLVSNRLRRKGDR